MHSRFKARAWLGRRKNGLSNDISHSPIYLISELEYSRDTKVVIFPKISGFHHIGNFELRL